MPRFVLYALFCAILSSACVAQASPTDTMSPPRQISLCELTQNPKNYSGQWVTVRAGVSMEFEDFSLYDPACHGSHGPGVWLTFGGDQGEIATYCCVNPTRKQGVDIEVEGHRVPLVRDDALHEFLRVLQTQRLRRPDGHPCESVDCYFYRPVTASLTGLFLARVEKEEGLAGYGHLGCCHLLVITQVSDVTAERTAVPAGGQFRCSEEKWNASQTEATVLNSLLDCATSHDETCGHDRETALSRIASHWNDKIDAYAGRWQLYTDATGDSIGNWVSADLLTTYSTVGKTHPSPPSLSVARDVCVPVSTELSPKPPSDHVSCEMRAISWGDDGATAEQVNKLMEKEQFDAADSKITEAAKAILAEGDQSWRMADIQTAGWHAIRAQTQKWGVVPDSELRLDKCDDNSVPDGKLLILGCGWYAPDGMQEFSVTLAKYPRSSEADSTGKNIPWSVWEISATTCRSESAKTPRREYKE